MAWLKKQEGPNCHLDHQRINQIAISDAIFANYVMLLSSLFHDSHLLFGTKIERSRRDPSRPEPL